MRAERACPHRGFMLDVSRHFFPPEAVKRLLRAAAACGANRMHWHLTDDQGWRADLARYPRLARTGGFRGGPALGAAPGTEGNDGFYTREEIRDIVAFAGDLGIEIIPEVDLPGHASALLAAYPEHGCRRRIWRDGRAEDLADAYRYRVLTTGGIFPNLVCAGRDGTLRFLEGILDEVMELFPFSMIHLGGDEAIKQRWRRCPDCRKRMDELGLADEEALQRWLILRLGEYLLAHGREPVVYNDALNGGPLPKSFIVQHWLGNDRETAEFLQSGGRVICADLERCYFDYPHSSVDAFAVYSAPPVPEYAKGNEAGILGWEGMLWTERVTGLDRAAYLLFPRLPALLAPLAGGPCPESWEAFAERLRDLRSDPAMAGLNWAPERLWRASEEDAAADRAEDALLHLSPDVLRAESSEKELLRLEQLEALLSDIGMPEPFALSVMDAAEAEIPFLRGLPAGDRLPGADTMADQLAVAVAQREEGAWKDLPEEVWLDTMRAYSRFVGEYFDMYGTWGFDRGFWTVRQMNALLFRLGALEYELRRREDGAPFIDLHIPSDIRLEPAALRDSLERARRFLARWRKDWADAPMECESWLLSPALEDILPAGAAINRFRRAFRVTSIDPEAKDFLQWVFGLPQEEWERARPGELPGDTTLRRNMKLALVRGEKIGSARGVLEADFR
ncbi:MAG: family 20 glycosylhydrolase [Clostridia bacterium]|nr:family 20 glycosylhydrolase [Clostridia bacterium]